MCRPVPVQVIRGQYDPLPESYSSALRTVVTSMLCKDVKARPDANTLLTVPAVVPHVQVRCPATFHTVHVPRIKFMAFRAASSGKKT